MQRKNAIVFNASLVLNIPVAFEAAWVLATLIQRNHIVDLCSGASFACRRRASSIPLGIAPHKILPVELSEKQEVTRLCPFCGEHFMMCIEVIFNKGRRPK